MQITVEIPDRLAQQLDQSAESLSQQLLEVIVANAYHSGKISTAEVRQLLQLPSRLETHAFLQRMGVYLNYDTTDLAQDLQTLQALRTP
jgi:predicted HTH domain antitoxin